MFNSKQIKKAWKIRREAAVKFGCGIMEISWKECLKMANEENVSKNEGLDFFVSHTRKMLEKLQSKPSGTEKRMIIRNRQIESYKMQIEVALNNEMPRHNDVKVAYMMVENKVMRIINNK